jgi:hypothetical protein
LFPPRSKLRVSAPALSCSLVNLNVHYDTNIARPIRSNGRADQPKTEMPIGGPR